LARMFSAQRLRDARIAAHFRPEQLALHIGRSVYSIHEYERGRSVPSVPVLVRLADTLGVSVDDLFEAVDANVA
jgi:transcriptional regulator with XRE-family HTH domain